MSIFNQIRGKLSILQYFGEGEIPVGGKLFKFKTKEFSDAPSDKYEDIEKLLLDERVYSIVALMAGLCQYAYKGPQLKPVDRYQDSELTKKEAKVLELADIFTGETGLDFKTLVFEIAWNVILHGEERFYYAFDEETKGVSDLVSVPLNASYFVEDKGQIKNKTKQVHNANVLVVNKDNTTSDVDTYKLGEFEQIAYHKRGVWRKDIEGRQTYGVYSIVPGRCLQNIVKWKLKTMENDVAWKNKLLPRILHKLKMGITSSEYPGATKQEKNDAALKDAKKLIQNFKNATKIDTPDEDLIVSDGVDTSILEPSSTSYQDPNNTLMQINNSINTPFGVPPGQIGGASGPSLSSELDSIFETIRVETTVNAIAKVLGKVVRKHLRITNPSLSAEIDRLYIHTDAKLPVHLHSLARSILALAKSGVIIKGELREIMGLPRLPQLPDEAFAKPGGDGLRISDKQTEKDLESEEPGANKNNDTPGGQKNTGENQRLPGEE